MVMPMGFLSRKSDTMTASKQKDQSSPETYTTGCCVVLSVTLVVEIKITMKKQFAFLMLVLLVSVSACSKKSVVSKKKTVATKPLPPGQMKKITGSQSAAPYAPGQQKKTTVQKSNGKSSATNGAKGKKK